MYGYRCRVGDTSSCFTSLKISKRRTVVICVGVSISRYGLFCLTLSFLVPFVNTLLTCVCIFPVLCYLYCYIVDSFHLPKLKRRITNPLLFLGNQF